MFWGAVAVLVSLSGECVSAIQGGSLRARGSLRKPDDATKQEAGNAAPIMEDDGGVEVSWSPTVSLTDESLEQTETRRSNVQEKLRLLRKSCDVSTSSCDQEVEETAANLRRLTIAVAQLRSMRQNEAENVEEDEKNKAVQEATVERDISDLTALQKFARLSKDDVDSQRQKYHNLSLAYGGKIEETQEAIKKVDAKLAKSRDTERTEDGSAVGFTSDAMAITNGVNATDAFVEEELMEAQRKEHSASVLFKKAQDMATRSASMLRYHRASMPDEEPQQSAITPITQSEEAEGTSSEDLPPCPPHHSDSDSFIQKACAPHQTAQVGNEDIQEAEAAAERARATAMREASSDDDSAAEDQGEADEEEEEDSSE